MKLAPVVKNLLEPISRKNTLEQVELGLHEALVNAVQHGNSLDPAKNIRIRRIMTPKWLVLQIQDEGIGLPMQSRISSLPTRLDAENGRGLFIIHQCFDDVRWSRKGNRLQIACKR